MQLILGITYVLIICFAFWGYGCTLFRAILHKIDHNIGLSVAFGICFFILFSSYLELFRLASPLLFDVFLLIGFLLAIFNLIAIGQQNRSHLANLLSSSSPLIFKNQPLLTSISIVTALLFSYIILAYFCHLPLNVHDDFNGYLILSQRILQEGFQGADPFNDHSIEQGFGAGNYIVALVANHVPLMSLHLADAGIGFLLLSAFVIDSLKKSPYFSFNAIGPCIFILCITSINAPIVNTTPLLIACGIFLAVIIFYIQSDFGKKPLDHVLLALLLSSFLVLKGNYIIPVAGLSLSIYISRIQITGFFYASKEFSIFCSSLLILTLPWMIGNWQFSGTPFYPLLGHGLVTPNALKLAGFHQFLEANLALFPSYCLLITLLVILTKSSPKASKHLFFFIFCISLISIFLSCALTMTSAGLFTRYSYVSLFGPTCFLLLYILFQTSPKFVFSNVRGNFIKIAVFFILAFACIPNLLYGFKYATKEVIKTLTGTPSHISQNLDIEMEMQRVRDLQVAIPMQSKILLRLDMPFLADFRNHKISVMDWPGNAGPAPGVPFSESPEALAAYLRKQGIKYIVYSYKNEALFSSKDSELAGRLNHPNPWIKTQASRTFSVQKQIESLGHVYRIILDNGQDFVLDLNQKAQ